MGAEASVSSIKPSVEPLWGAEGSQPEEKVEEKKEEKKRRQRDNSPAAVSKRLEAVEKRRAALVAKKERLAAVLPTDAPAPVVVPVPAMVAPIAIAETPVSK